MFQFLIKNKYFDDLDLIWRSVSFLRYMVMIVIFVLGGPALVVERAHYS